jgi:hypothetical protein
MISVKITANKSCKPNYVRESEKSAIEAEISAARPPLTPRERLITNSQENHKTRAAAHELVARVDRPLGAKAKHKRALGIDLVCPE